MSRRATNLGLAVLGALFALEALYLVGANLLLRHRLAALSREGPWTLEARGLRTLYPGDLRAQQLDLSQSPLGLRVGLEGLEARLALLPLLRGVVDVEGLSARRVKARLESATFGAWQMQGPSALDATSVVIASGHVRARGELRFLGARLARLGGAGQATLRGKLSLRLRPAAAAGPSSWQRRLAAKGRFSAELRNAGELLRLPQAKLKLARARVEGRCAFEHGEWRGCKVELTSHSASGRTQQVKWRATRGVRLALNMTADPNRQVRAALSSDHLHLEVARPGADRPLSIERSAKLELHAPLADLNATRVALTDAVLSWRSLGEASHEGLAEGELDVTRALWSPASGLEFAGKIHESGPDAGVLLDLLNVEPALSWSLSELRGRAFRLEMSLKRSAVGVALDDIELETQGLGVRGDVYWQGQEPRGALLVQRGKLQLGLLLQGDSSELDLKPKSHWLREATRQLADSRAGT